MAFSKKRDAALLIEKELTTIWELLKERKCPFIQYVDFKYFSEAIYEENSLRFNILEWILLSISPSLEFTFLKKDDVMLEDKARWILQMLAALGLCSLKDFDLIKGYTTKKKQTTFLLSLSKLLSSMEAEIDLDMMKYDPLASEDSLREEHHISSSAVKELLSKKSLRTDTLPSLQLFPPEIMLMLEKDKKHLDSSSIFDLSIRELEGTINQFENEIDREFVLLQNYNKASVDFTTEQSLLASTKQLSVCKAASENVESFSKMVKNVREWFCLSEEEASPLGPLAKEANDLLLEISSCFEDMESFRITYDATTEVHKEFEEKILSMDDKNHKSKRALLNQLLQNWIKVIDDSIKQLEQKEKL